MQKFSNGYLKFTISNNFTPMILSRIGLFISISCLLMANYSHAQNRTAEEPDKKVVFIIVDGIAEDMLKEADTSNLNRIQKEGTYLPAHVGGDKETFNQSPTISAVGYTSLLTGTWKNKHNVFDNYQQYPNYNYPTIFRVFKDQYPDKKTAIFSTWRDNRTVLIGEGRKGTDDIKMDMAYDSYENDTTRFPHDKKHQYIRNIDSLVAKKASHSIRKEAPDLSWVYLQFSDDMGHGFGDSDILYNAISFEDKLVGEIYDAVQEREKDHEEDWLFIVTTDHGRSPVDGKGHGGQTDRERHTWMVLNQPDLNSYAQENRVAITDLFPTMADFLDIKVPYNTKQEVDGVSLLTDVKAFGLKAGLKENNLKVTWETAGPTGNEDGEIYISTTNNFRHGGRDDYQYLGKTKLTNEKFSAQLPKNDSQFYKVILKTDSGVINTWIVKK